MLLTRALQRPIEARVQMRLRARRRHRTADRRSKVRVSLLVGRAERRQFRADDDGRVRVARGARALRRTRLRKTIPCRAPMRRRAASHPDSSAAPHRATTGTAGSRGPRLRRRRAPRRPVLLRDRPRQRPPAAARAPAAIAASRTAATASHTRRWRPSRRAPSVIVGAPRGREDPESSSFSFADLDDGPLAQPCRRRIANPHHVSPGHERFFRRTAQLWKEIGAGAGGRFEDSWHVEHLPALALRAALARSSRERRPILQLPPLLRAVFELDLEIFGNGLRPLRPACRRRRPSARLRAPPHIPQGCRDSRLAIRRAISADNA